MLKKTSHFMREANLIGGSWVQADSGETIEVVNPANGQTIGTVPKCGRAETRRAIEAAEAAFHSWKKTSANDRAKLLRRLHDVIMDNQDALAELLVLEQGKPLAEAKGEVGMSAAYILWFAEEARRVYGDVVPSPWADRRILVTKEPVGVIGAITPWNFPSSMLRASWARRWRPDARPWRSRLRKRLILALPGACLPRRRVSLPAW